MRRTYHSDRSSSELQRDVSYALRHHGAQSPEYKRAYMRWYRAGRPELRAADVARLEAYRAGPR